MDARLSSSARANITSDNSADANTEKRFNFMVNLDFAALNMFKAISFCAQIKERAFWTSAFWRFNLLKIVLLPAQLAFELPFKLGNAVAEALDNLPGLRRHRRAVFAMMARGVAALDRIVKFLAAGAAGALAVGGGGWGGHGNSMEMVSRRYLETMP
jgi:hypothetical protein